MVIFNPHLVLTMAQGLQSCDLSLTRSHSNYLAQVSINISKAQSDSNEIVLRMTLVASILVPLNIVTGLWGMNVRLIVLISEYRVKTGMTYCGFLVLWE